MQDLINITIGNMLNKRAEEYPDTDAVVYPHRNIRWSYSQFRDICDRAARGFLAMGIKKGDHVAIWANNRPEWLITQFATAKIGAAIVTVNTNYKKFELEYLMKQSDSMTLILTEGYKDSNYLEHLKELCPELEQNKKGELESKKLPCLKNVIYIGDEKHAGMFNWSELDAMADEIGQEELEDIEASLDVHDVITMMYTSGTTGFPKGVMLTHYNLTNNGMSMAECMKFTEKDRLCIPVPLFHCFGCVLGVMTCVSKGTSMIMVDQFHPLRVMEAIDWEKCTAVHGVPTMFISIMEHPDFEKFDYSTLRTGIMAGSLCPIEVMKRAVNDMNMSEITIVFGQTESSPGITQSKTDDPIELRVTTVGKVLPHVEAKIVDPETGEDMPPETTGEIVARGYNVMKGYYKMPEATNQAIDKEGWLHTGDLGVMDVNGYFRVTGRLKDMIIRGGENIYPREIEEFLYTHAAVRDVQVVGVPDEKYGEEIMAYIILKEGITVSEEEIIKYVKEGLSRFKTPRYIRFVDEFPMTASGKIQKYVLREMGIQELDLGNIQRVDIT